MWIAPRALSSPESLTWSKKAPDGARHNHGPPLLHWHRQQTPRTAIYRPGLVPPNAGDLKAGGICFIRERGLGVREASVSTHAAHQISVARPRHMRWAQSHVILVKPQARPARLRRRGRRGSTTIQAPVVINVLAFRHITANCRAFQAADGAHQTATSRVRSVDVLQRVGVGVVAYLRGPDGTYVVHVDFLEPRYNGTRMGGADKTPSLRFTGEQNEQVTGPPLERPADPAAPDGFVILPAAPLCVLLVHFGLQPSCVDASSGVGLLRPRALSPGAAELAFAGRFPLPV